MLANQAARLLDEPENWLDYEAPTLVASRTALPPEGAVLAWGGPARSITSPTLVASRTALPPEGAVLACSGPARRTSTIEKLALRLGVSDRHLRRIFDAEFGVSPLQYLQTRRLHTAKQLLADTGLPITQIALMSGYQSVRRFNAAFAGHYKLNPTQLRRGQLESEAVPKAGEAGQSGTECSTIRLGYRPPYDAAAMLGFFSKRAIAAIESIAECAGRTGTRRTFGIKNGEKHYSGWLQMSFDEPRSQLVLQVSDSLRDVLPLVIRRVRALLDLDADPQSINAVLHQSFPGADGLRVPGSLDGFELAVRAVLGQQITVAAARTLAQRLVEKLGQPIQTPWPELNRLFPTPDALASLDLASGDILGQLGIVRQRQTAIVGIARALLDKRLQLNGGAEVDATVLALKSLPGIGDWTAQYIAMRALRWPDAFPAGDVALQKALGVQVAKNPAKAARAAEEASGAWKPWRSYAVIRVWGGSWAGTATPSMAVVLPAETQTPAKSTDAIESIAEKDHPTSTPSLKGIKNALQERAS